MFELALIYTITIILSIIVAFLLVRLASLSSQARAWSEKTRKEKKVYPATFTDGSLRRQIYDEIVEFVDAKARDEASQRLFNIFNKELEKKITQKEEELNKKYERIISQKSQTEEIAWKKYKNVLVQKNQVEAIIRSVAEGVVVVDKDGKVIMMNPAAERLLGISHKEKIGKSLLENLKKEQLISLVKGSEDKEDREIDLISPQDETKKTIRASTAVIENENGQTIGMVSVLSDITKQKELEQMKADFLAKVTHELRTPLVAMDKSLSLLLDKSTGDVSEDQQELLSIAQRNLKRLNYLINDLLDLSRMEAGRIELKRSNIAVSNIIDEIIQSLDAWAKTKEIKITARIEENLPELNCDSQRIGQVLINLVGNAIKFTPQKGSIIIEAKLSRDKKEIEISVEDNGVGIAKEELTKIFDKFYQAAERAPTDITGFGIGLAIAKEIVELHGGRIWAESEKGQGAKFTFTLPL